MTPALSGCRILVVEDEFFLALELEDELSRAGAEVVGPIPDLGEASRQIRADGFDIAVLDINLGGTLVYPLADELAAAGIPFLFASAYPASDIPVRHRHRRLVEKPYSVADLLEALAELAGRQPIPGATRRA